MDYAEKDLIAGLLEDGLTHALSRAERRDQQVHRILEAAKACFVRTGFQRTSMQQICAEAGMSPGALYRYFPSKEAIIEAICEADRLEDAEIIAAMADNPCPVDGFVNAAMAHVRHVHESGKAPLFAEIRAEATRNEAIREIRERCMGEVRETFRNHLSAAAERGDIDPKVELEALMAMIMAIGEGLCTNDLPGLGVPYDRIEKMLRAMAEALLRPTRHHKTAGN
jgi:TetR/AcrR family transcriptional repressor of uid operon